MSSGVEEKEQITRESAWQDKQNAQSMNIIRVDGRQVRYQPVASFAQLRRDDVELRKVQQDVLTQIDEYFGHVCDTMYDQSDLQEKLLNRLQGAKERAQKATEQPVESDPAWMLGRAQFEIHRVHIAISRAQRTREEEQRLRYRVPWLIAFYVAVIVLTIVLVGVKEAVTESEQNNNVPATTFVFVPQEGQSEPMTDTLFVAAIEVITPTDAALANTSSIASASAALTSVASTSAASTENTAKTENAFVPIMLPVIYVPLSVLVWAGLGSIAAILYRFYTVKQGPIADEIRWLIARPLIGIIMGALAYTAIASGLFILGSSTNAADANQIIPNPHLMWIIAFFGGFSDRFFVSLIDTVMGYLPSRNTHSDDIHSEEVMSQETSVTVKRSSTQSASDANDDDLAADADDGVVGADVPVPDSPTPNNTTSDASK